MSSRWNCTCDDEVPREGLEPSTFGLRVRCSNQLSYQGSSIVPKTRFRPSADPWSAIATGVEAVAA